MIHRKDFIGNIIFTLFPGVWLHVKRYEIRLSEKWMDSEECLDDNTQIRLCMVLLQVLEEEKVHELLNIGEFPLYMIPLDEDVLSFELDLAQKVCEFLYFVGND